MVAVVVGLVRTRRRARVAGLLARLGSAGLARTQVRGRQNVLEHGRNAWNGPTLAPCCLSARRARPLRSRFTGMSNVRCSMFKLERAQACN